MFTGLVECRGTLTEVRPEPPGRRLVIAAEPVAQGTQVGDSVAVSGCCLTVVAVDGERLTFEAGPETLSRTILGELAAGDEVNLERSLRPGDRLGGHFVTGHVDAVGRVERRETLGEWVTVWFEAPADIGPHLASKGSIAVDGVSLTVVDVAASRFSVQLIPHTLEVTTLGRLSAGSRVNLETDLLAKYVARQLEYMAARPSDSSPAR